MLSTSLPARREPYVSTTIASLTSQGNLRQQTLTLALAALPGRPVTQWIGQSATAGTLKGPLIETSLPCPSQSDVWWGTVCGLVCPCMHARTHARMYPKLHLMVCPLQAAAYLLMAMRTKRALLLDATDNHISHTPWPGGVFGDPFHLERLGLRLGLGLGR